MQQLFYEIPIDVATKQAILLLEACNIYCWLMI